MTDKRLDVLKSMGDHYGDLYKRVHYLFVGNGAGFAGGLTLLKDHPGIGLVIALFGIGLIAAVVTYITLAISQMKAKSAALDKKTHDPSMPVFYLHYGSLVVSGLAFIVAIGLVIYRVAAL